MQGVVFPQWVSDMWTRDVFARANITEPELLEGCKYAYEKLTKTFDLPLEDAKTKLLTLKDKGAITDKIYKYLIHVRTVAEEKLERDRQERFLQNPKVFFGKIPLCIPTRSVSTCSATTTSSSAVSSSSVSSATSAAAAFEQSNGVANSTTCVSAQRKPSRAASPSRVLRVSDLDAKFVMFHVPLIKKVVAITWKELRQLPRHRTPLAVFLHPIQILRAFRRIWRGLNEMADSSEADFEFSAIVEISATEAYLNRPEQRATHLLRFDCEANSTKFQLVDINGAVEDENLSYVCEEEES